MTDLFDVGTPEGRNPEARASRRARRQDSTRKAERRSRRWRTMGAVLVSLAVVSVAVYYVFPLVINFVVSDPPADYPGPGTGSVMLEVPAGSTGSDIARILYDADVVASPEAFIKAYNADPNATGIQAGFYNLRYQMSAAGAVAAMQDRANRAEISITVPDGVRAATIYQRISTATGIPLEEVQAAAADTAAYGLPEEAGGNPEGWLGAQTYILPPTVDATTVLNAMVQETIGLLVELAIPREEWQASIIKASIAQREAVVADFGKVVRVIINRADPANPETVGMLGMDSVVLYGLGLDGVLLDHDQKAIDTPFNTFMHPGLPPTPICTPSPDAIKATVDPPEGNWNYFVTVNFYTGETRFAETYAEFQVYLQEYRDWLAANPDAHPGTGDVTQAP